ncbi:probable ubiquitin carboxyl-terminal hydrolase MINDY-4 isoform X2 [Dysidea avara]|uniref:probable ubiquitin carboxyl-terminal hydrolase MINDY-4 isoform X2 n=1 Tax=Dysidea avara TaxID=196820 RepID=UPI0033243A91
MTTVEQLSLALVREFLNRKGLKATLASMDAECPRTAESISSRTVLCKEIHLEHLMKKNKDHSSPFKTIIEVIVRYFVERGKNTTSEVNVVSVERSSLNETPTQEEETTIKSGLTTNQTLVDNKLIHLTSTTTSHVPSLGAVYDSLLQEDTDKPVATESISDQTIHDSYQPLEKSPATNSSKALATTSARHISRSRDVMVTHTAQPVIVTGSKNKKTKPLRVSHKIKDRYGTTTPHSPVKTTTSIPATSEPVLTFGEQNREDVESAGVHSHSVVNTVVQQRAGMELSLEDVDDDDIQHLSTVTTASLGLSRELLTSSEGKLISKETVKQLRKLLFGSSKGTFNDEWIRQNFVFSSVPGLEYGLVQHKGGPCGVLATVQAFVLKHLMFEGTTSSMADKNGALINAMVDVLWKARSHDCVNLALPDIKSSSGLTGDTLDELVLHERRNVSELKGLLQASLPFFTGHSGCILLLTSVILTKGIRCIVNEMDEPTNKLIGHHSYCTQDLVNLFLIGKAVSNTHDGVITLGTGNDSMQLKGLDCQSEIGFLSLFEYYKSCTVGVNYKQPRYPIWVVCSESHFSVLFNSSKDFFIRQPAHFDLLYFNGLGEQDEEIRLTIDTTQHSEIVNEADDLVSPLELCIRTCAY